MHIMCDWREDLILAQAQASTQRYLSGNTLGDLDGVPIVFKDQIKIKGLTVRYGMPFPDCAPCEKDAAVVERIRKQGMTIVGLVNMHQAGPGGTIGTNPSKYHGDCRNPFNTDYYCGASSSGPGAAVAVGLVPCAIGSDGGGSVRIPSAFCGLIGLKPTAGRIPHRGYSATTNSVLGPMCNTMTDCLKLYSVLAGPDYNKESEITQFQPKVTVPRSLAVSLKGTKIGVDYQWCDCVKENTIKMQFWKMLNWLQDKGLNNLIYSSLYLQVGKLYGIRK